MASRALRTSRPTSWTRSERASPSPKSCGATTRDTSLSGRSSPGIKSGSSGIAWMTPSRYAPRTHPRASCSPRTNSSSTGTRPAVDTHPGRASSGSLPGCTYSKTTISRTGSALPRSTAYRFAWASMRPGRARRTRSPSCKPSSRSARTRRALSRTAHRSTSSPRRRRQALTCTNASPDIATSKSPRQSSGRRSPLTLAAEATPRARRTTTSGTT